MKTKTNLVVAILIATLIFTMLGITNVKAEELGSEVMIRFGEEYPGVELSTVEGVTYNETTNTLTLSDVNYTANSLFAAEVGDNFKINVEGSNTISGIMISAGSLTITGEGTLTIDGETPIIIYGEKLTIDENVTVNLESTSKTLIQMQPVNATSANGLVVLKNGDTVNVVKKTVTTESNAWIAGIIGDAEYTTTCTLYKDANGKKYAVDYEENIYDISEEAVGKTEWGEDYYTFTLNESVDLKDLTEVPYEYDVYTVSGTELTVEPKSKTEDEKKDDEKTTTDDKEEVKEEETATEEKEPAKEEEKKEETKTESTVVAEDTASEEDVPTAEEVGKLVDEIVAGKEVEGIDEETAAKIVEAKEAGKTIKVEVSNKQIEAEEVKEDVEKIEEKIGEASKVAAVFDINVLVKADGTTLGKVTKLGNKVRLALPIPEDIPAVPAGYTRTFGVATVHNGVTSELDSEVDGDTIYTDAAEFSTYAITYTDTKTTSNPTTGDAIALFVGLFAVASVSAIAVYRKIK